MKIDLLKPEDRDYLSPYLCKIAVTDKDEIVYYLEERMHIPGFTFQITATSIDGLKWLRSRLDRCQGFTRIEGLPCPNADARITEYISAATVMRKKLCVECRGRLLNPNVGAWEW
jgi:hypothetical protein